MRTLGEDFSNRGDEKLKSFLENLNQPLFVRMTGSGSVIVAYYQKNRDCELAKVKLLVVTLELKVTPPLKVLAPVIVSVPAK